LNICGILSNRTWESKPCRLADSGWKTWRFSTVGKTRVSIPGLNKGEEKKVDNVVEPGLSLNIWVNVG